MGWKKRILVKVRPARKKKAIEMNVVIKHFSYVVLRYLPHCTLYSLTLFVKWGICIYVSITYSHYLIKFFTSLFFIRFMF